MTKYLNVALSKIKKELITTRDLPLVVNVILFIKLYQTKVIIGGLKCSVPSIKDAFFGSRELKVAEMDGPAGASPHPPPPKKNKKH